MKIIDCEQNSPEWYAARLGKITASGMSSIISPTGKQSVSVSKYVSKLIAEIITGQSDEAFKGNIHTERGHALEDEACDYYAMLRGVEPQRVGFCVTDDDKIGCSPDRLIGDDGMLEIKTCLSSIMIDHYENEKLEQEHRPQTQCGLYVTGRQWIDTMLYHPSMKPIIVRSERNTPYIMDMVKFSNEAHQSLRARMVNLAQKGFIDGECYGV